MSWRPAAPGAGNSRAAHSGRQDRNGVILRCSCCGSHLRGEGWERYCSEHWHWRFIAWHIVAAQRGLIALRR